MATIDDIIAKNAQTLEKAEARADSALAKADSALVDSNRAVEGLGVNWWSAYVNPTDVVPLSITKPVIPTNDFSLEVKQAFDHAFTSFNEDLRPQIISYINEFFPDITDALKTDSDNWLINVIGNGAFVPAAVEAAIWNRARDKELQDAGRVEQAIIDSAAARGFSMPPGAMQAAVNANIQDTQVKLNTINRDIAVKAFDVANDNAKFAIQQAVSLRTSFVAALGDFIRTAMVQPNQASDYAKTILASKTALYDSAVSLYGAQIQEENLRTSVELGNRKIEHENLQTWIAGRQAVDQAQLGVAQLKATQAITAAKVLTEVAAASLATTNSVMSAAASV